MEAKGYVTYVGSTKFGKKELYSFRVNTEEKWFGTGTVDSLLKKNDYIKFSYTENNGRFNVDPSSIEHIKLEGSVEANGGASSTGSVRSGTKSSYWDSQERIDRDKANDQYRKENDLRIQYQSARNAAISVVDVLLRERALKLADGSKADNVSVILGKITDLTNQFYHDTSNASGHIGHDTTLSGDEDIPFESSAGKGSEVWS